MALKYRENVIAAWAFLVGVILAILVAVLAQDRVSPIVQTVLAILGIVVGYFVAEKDIQTFLLASVSLVIVSFAGIQGMFLNAAISGTSIIKLMTYILGALLNMFVPATIIVALKSVFSISKS